MKVWQRIGREHRWTGGFALGGVVCWRAGSRAGRLSRGAAPAFAQPAGGGADLSAARARSLGSGHGTSRRSASPTDSAAVFVASLGWLVPATLSLSPRLLQDEIRRQLRPVLRQSLWSADQQLLWHAVRRRRLRLGWRIRLACRGADFWGEFGGYGGTADSVDRAIGGGFGGGYGTAARLAACPTDRGPAQSDRRAVLWKAKSSKSRCRV